MPIPTWAWGLPPADQIAAASLELDTRRRTAVGEVEVILADLRRVRTDIKARTHPATVIKLIDEIGIRARSLLTELDRS
jgi:hypothetical protein